MFGIIKISPIFLKPKYWGEKCNKETDWLPALLGYPWRNMDCVCETAHAYMITRTTPWLQGLQADAAGSGEVWPRLTPSFQHVLDSWGILSNARNAGAWSIFRYRTPNFVLLSRLCVGTKTSSLQSQSVRWGAKATERRHTVAHVQLQCCATLMTCCVVFFCSSVPLSSESVTSSAPKRAA